MPTRRWWTRSHGWWWWLVAAIAIALPLARLWPLDGQFVFDWFNHKWLSGYTGQYLRVHGSLPVVLNTSGQAGMAFPVMYGTLFYPVVGLFTAWLSPDLVVRLAVLAVTGLQFHLVTRAFVRLGVARWPARGIACLTIWAIYPLTNLYNRSAITEYVAVALLTGAFATWFLLIHAETAASRRRLAHGFCLLLTLVAGTHPITALYSLPMLGMLVIAAFSEHGTSRTFWTALVRALIVPGLLGVVALLPWLYAVRAFKAHIQINHTIVPFFYKGIDEWSTRFWPVPFDPRTLGRGIGLDQHPYLDAQLNLPLLILLLAWVVLFGWRRRDRAVVGLRSVALGLVAFVFFLWISVEPSSYEIVPRFLRLVQLAYRAISFQNLAILLALFMLVGAIRRRGDPVVTPRPKLLGGLFAACLVLALAGVAIKWSHATAVMSHSGPGSILASEDERRGWSALPPQFYGLYGYATARLYAPMTAEPAWDQVWVPMGQDDEFGEPQDLTVTYSRDTWVGTNLQAFPWNAIYIDGKRVPAEQLRVETSRLVAQVPAGTHTLSLKTLPDGAWIWLRRIGVAVFALWLAAFVAMIIRARRGGSESSRGDASGSVSSAQVPA